MKTYGSRSFTVNISKTLKQLIVGNKQRLSLIISSGATPGVNGIMDLYTGTGATAGFIRVYAGAQLIMPYRDYGPLIREAVFATFTMSNADVVATEIFEIPTQ